MNQGYLSDEELKRLIDDVEDTKMLQAPVYLKQQVLETLDAEKIHRWKKQQQRRLVVFEMKIAGGLAAAMIMLFLLPVAAQGEQTGMTQRPAETKVQEFFQKCSQISDQMLNTIDTISDQMLEPWQEEMPETTDTAKPWKKSTKE